MLKSPLTNCVLFSLFWALNIFVTKLAFNQGAQPVAFLIQSGVITLLVFLFLVVPTMFAKLKKLERQDLKDLILSNVWHFGLGGFFSTIGIALTSAINASFLMKFSLVSTIILAHLMIHEKITRIKIIAMGTMLLGGFLMSTNGQLITPKLGDIFIIVACICWSMSNILSRRLMLRGNITNDMVTIFRPIVGLPILLLPVLCALFLPPTLQKIFQVEILNFTYWQFFVLNGIFVAGNWIFLNRTLAVATASYNTLVSSITPIIVSVFAFFALQEVMSLTQIIGAALIFSAAVITHIYKMHEHQPVQY